MISARTVLVLGAGSSMHCGYPLGRQLVAQLCAPANRAKIRTIGHPWGPEHVSRFLDQLSRSDPNSIDAHLERNRADLELGKYLIARQLKQFENLDALFPPNDAGWYRRLFDSLLDCDEPAFDRSPISIVTFNYDRSLEAYLHARLTAQFGMDEAAASEHLGRLAIVHVHGILGDYPDVPYSASDDSATTAEVASKIQIVHELTERDGEFCNDAFRRAHSLLAAAERIFFLGFGWHRDNLRRFHFFKPGIESGRLIRATCPGLGRIEHDALASYLSEFGIPSSALTGYDCNTFFTHATSIM